MGRIHRPGASRAVVLAASLGVACGGSDRVGEPSGASGAVANVVVAPDSASLMAGQAIQFSATLRDVDGNVLMGRAVAWTSETPDVGAVSSTGLVRGIAPGTARIIATSEGRSGSASISVAGWRLVGAGDIADAAPGAQATATILDSIVELGALATVFTAGDNAYTNGTIEEYMRYYDPTWGRHRAITRPTLGNHEYGTTSDAADYFAYFGSLAGPAGRGYYSYDWGPWHIVSLNSNVAMQAGSSQEQWLRADLAAATADCVLAYWHHPTFSSGSHGNEVATTPLYQALYDYRVEVLVVGHDHDYERFAPQDPTGQLDPERGVREFVVGTGGRELRPLRSSKPNSEVRYDGGFGVIAFTLHDGGYTWAFISEAGKAFHDAGTGTCH